MHQWGTSEILGLLYSNVKDDIECERFLQFFFCGDFKKLGVMKIWEEEDSKNFKKYPTGQAQFNLENEFFDENGQKTWNFAPSCLPEEFFTLALIWGLSNSKKASKIDDRGRKEVTCYELNKRNEDSRWVVYFGLTP